MRTIACFMMLLAALALGCASPTLVPILSTAGLPVTQTPHQDVPLEVITRSTGVPDPLPVDGSSVRYAEVETALGHAISTATVPWADRHQKKRPEGWQITVEMIAADASYNEGRLIVTLGVRATLRTRLTRTYLAQTQANCRQSALVRPEAGAPVLFACMERIGRDLTGWLGQVEP